MSVGIDGQRLTGLVGEILPLIAPYNGLMYSSEIARGLDIFDLLPSQYLSENEIAAAKQVRHDEFNPQNQPHIEWPATFEVARAYLDQLERSNGLPAARIAAVRQALDAAEAAIRLCEAEWAYTVGDRVGAGCNAVLGPSPGPRARRGDPGDRPSSLEAWARWGKPGAAHPPGGQRLHRLTAS